MRDLMKDTYLAQSHSLLPEAYLPANAEPIASFKYPDLIQLFAQIFAESENTQLVKGEGEPVYLPANEYIDHHRIIFAHGFFASALHEIAHWCLAGKARRLQEDYGYWYCPDGRNTQQQAEFEQVEIKPQASEWGFSLACGKAFRVSTDNLNGAPVDIQGFTQNVRRQALYYLQHGFPPRAQQFIEALQAFYQTPAFTERDFHA
jgi:elongation factor P hydroxylase